MTEKQEKKEDSHWYILNVRKGKEETIVKKIESEINKLKPEKKNDLFKKIKELIPASHERYILCNLDIDKEIISFFYKIPGVINFLEYTHNISEIPRFLDSEKANTLLRKIKEKSLKKEEDNKKQIEEELKELEHEFKKTDRIRIREGTFKSYEGIITRINSKKTKIDVDLDSDGSYDLINKITLKNVPIENCQIIIKKS